MSTDPRLQQRYRIRDYRDADEPSWLQCRLLSFFHSTYHDDVRTARDQHGRPTFGLVATVPGTRRGPEDVIGIIDVDVDGTEATIDTVAVDPEHARRGIASALLDATVDRLSGSGVRTLAAWTREDPAANQWYRAAGFTEQYRYLHVYLQDGDDADGFATPQGLSTPVRAFMHAPIELEEQMRRRFARVHVCRQYLHGLDP